MRNIITLNKGKISPVSSNNEEEGDTEQWKLIDSVFDTLSDSITCVLGKTDIGQWEVQQFNKDGSMNVLASFNTQTFNDRLLSFAHFAELGQLLFVFEQGDIVTATYDESSFDPTQTTVEIVGSIDNGISAAVWSPDEEVLAIVTKDRSVVLLSKLYETIAEYQLQVDDLKMSKHVTVGWGKKETQFRGKGARAMEREALAGLKASGLVGDELRDPTMPYLVDTGKITNLDTHEVQISWRGDCEYFVLSTVEKVEDPDDSEKTIERRALRVFTRDGQLDSASEPVDGMEEGLSWKPQGALIASIQRKSHMQSDESLQLIFFERNGLRHGGFDTRLDINEKVKNISWNSSSEILTLALEDKIQLWVSKNYHWYLKQELYAPAISFVKWHPEKELTLLFGSADEINIVNFTYRMTQGPTLEPFDNGSSLVVDGNTINITPLAIANVPPPIYFRDFETPGNVIDVATSLSNEIYAALNKDCLVVATVPTLDDMKKGSHPTISCVLPKAEFASEYDTLRQVSFINDSTIGVLLDSDYLSRIALIDVQDTTQPTVLNIIETFDKVLLLRSTFDYNHLAYETRDGTIVQIDVEGQLTQVTKLPQIVCDFRVKRVVNSVPDDNSDWNNETSELVVFGLSETGKLYANHTQLATAVTSLEITNSLLLFTTAQHNLQFVHLNRTHFEPLPMVQGQVTDERIRAIERGSILVSVMPSKAAVVLQASRGNLETIYPRIMVLAGVRKNITAKRYKEAFISCRTHRIHLDILHDYAPDLFFGNLDLFIEQIDRVDYLDLFISCLIEDDVTETVYKDTISKDYAEDFEVAKSPPTEMQLYMKKKLFDPSKSKVNKICEAIATLLLSKPEYKEKFIQSIITAYASQTPQKIDEALKLISAISDTNKKDSCLSYLCFLHDVNKVYQVALSLYDVKLALAVAQKSQMDPKEYLPFLQKLYEEKPLRRQFLIDDHLKFYTKALKSLIESFKEESTVSQEVLHYITLHTLYKDALTAYKYDTIKQNDVYLIFAKHLSSTQEYHEAAMIYDMLRKFKEAMENYTLAKKWQEALQIAKQHFPEKLLEVAEELVGSLSFEHKHMDVAEIQLLFLDDIESSLENYCKAYRFDTACLVAATHAREDLLEKIVDPGLGNGFGVIAELLADCKGQVNSQLRRLRELRTKKEEDPYAFYGQETEQSDDVSVAPSETSTKESFFTRYTGKTKGTAQTGVSRRTSKNKRREERKRARGKKGTIYEEEYLVKSIGRLIDRLGQTRPDACKLVQGLLRRDMREQAHQIQHLFVEVTDFLKENITEIYNISEQDRERIGENGEVYHLPEIPIPEIPEFPKSKLVDF